LQALCVDYGGRLALSLPIRMARGWLSGVTVAAWCRPEDRPAWIGVLGRAEQRGERLGMVVIGLCAALDLFDSVKSGRRVGAPSPPVTLRVTDPVATSTGSDRSMLRRVIGAESLLGLAIGGLAVVGGAALDADGPAAAAAPFRHGLIVFVVALTLLEAVALMDLGRWYYGDHGRR